MVKKIVIILLLIVVTLISSCNKPHESIETRDNMSVSKFSDATNRFYEETPDGYKAAFYEKSEITIKKILDWLESCEPSEMYYQYIYSDPDSWDMFICYLYEGGEIYNSLMFRAENQVVKIYITHDKSLHNPEQNSPIIIRIQAPPRVLWPTSSELYVNDIKIEKN